MAKDAVQSYIDLLMEEDAGPSYMDAVESDETIIKDTFPAFDETSEYDETNPSTNYIASSYADIVAGAQPEGVEGPGVVGIAGTALWGALDEALFSIPELIATKGLGVEFKPWEEQTGWEQAAETSGRFAGFAFGGPLKAGRKAVEWVGRKTIQKVLKKETTDQVINRSKKEAIDAARAVSTGSSRALEATIKEAGGNYYQINSRAQWSNSLAKNFKEKTAINIDQLIKKKIALKEITDVEARAIKKVFLDNLTTQSPSNFISLMQIKYGRKKGTLLGEMLNEALVWGTIDAAMEFPKSLAEDRPYDWMVPVYGVTMGTALGALSLTGKAGKNASFRATLGDGLRGIFKKDVYKDLDLPALRTWSRNHADTMRRNSAGQRLDNSVKTTTTVKIGDKSYSLNFAQPASSLRIKGGKVLDDEFQAKILRKALTKQKNEYGRELVSWAFKEEWGNVVQNWPRMLGGMGIMFAPTGLQMAMSDDEIHWQTGLVHMLMGAYIMRKGYSGDWDIDGVNLSRLRRGLQSLGIDVKSNVLDIPLYPDHGFENIDPFKTSEQLADLKGQATQLGIITTDVDAAKAFLPDRSAYMDVYEGHLPLFNKFWASLGNSLDVAEYRTHLESIPSSVAQEMEARLERGTWSALGNTRMVSPGDYDKVYDQSVLRSVDTFSANIESTLKQVLNESGLDYDTIEGGANLGKLWQSVSIDPRLEEEARLGADGVLKFLFKGEDAGLKGQDGVELAEIKMGKVNRLINIAKRAFIVGDNTNQSTQFRVLGDPNFEPTVKEAADKFKYITDTIEAMEKGLTEQLGGKVRVDLSNPNQDLPGWMEFNAMQKTKDNIALGFDKREKTHIGLRNGLLNAGILVGKEGSGEVFIPERISNLSEIIEGAPSEDDKMLAIQMIRAAHTLLSTLKQYKSTDLQPKKIAYSSIMGSSSGSLRYELNTRRINPELFIQTANKISEGIVQKQIAGTRLATNDVTFLNSFMLIEDMDLVRWNAIAGEKYTGFLAKLVETTSTDAEHVKIADTYNRSIKQISEASRDRDGRKLVGISDDKVLIKNPNELKRLEDTMFFHNQYFDDKSNAKEFLTKFFNAIEGFEPLKQAAADFMRMNQSHSSRLAGVLHSTGIIKVDPRMGSDAYIIDSKDFQEKFTDEARKKIMKYMTGYGVSVDAVEARMTELANRYHTDAESMYESSIGKKAISQSDYFKKYFGLSAVDVKEQNNIIRTALSYDDNSDAALNIIRQMSHIDEHRLTFNVKTKLPQISNARYSEMLMETMGMISGRIGSGSMNTMRDEDGTFKFGKQLVQRNIISNYLNEDFAGQGINTILIDPKVKVRDSDTGELKIVDVSTVHNKDLTKDHKRIKTRTWKDLQTRLEAVESFEIASRTDANDVPKIDTTDEAGIHRGFAPVVLGQKLPLLGVFRKDYKLIASEFISVMSKYQEGGDYANLLDSHGKQKLKLIMDHFDVDHSGQFLNRVFDDYHAQAVRDLLYERMIGPDEFATYVNAMQGYADVGKIEQRLSLAFTPSAKRLSKDLLNITLKGLAEAPDPTKASLNRQAVNHYIKKGTYGVAIYQDDPTSQFSVSIKKRYEKVVEDIFGPGEGPQWSDTQSGRKDQSGFDSIAFISDRQARMLSATYGMSFDGRHAIWKPIISSNEPGKVLYGKTVLIYDPYTQKRVFAKNDQLDILLMETGAKIGGGDRVTMPIDDILSPGNKAGFLHGNTVQYDLSTLGIVQAPKQEAAGKFGHQLTSYMDDVNWKPIWEAYYEGNVMKANRLMDSYVENPVMGREFMLDRGGLDNDFLLAEMSSTGAGGENLSHLSTYLGASKYADPMAFGKNMVMNAMKRKIIDAVMNPTSSIKGVKYGGKSVLIQSMDPKWRNMRQTIVTGKGEASKVTQYGEVGLSAYEYDTPLSRIVTEGEQKHDFSLRFIRRKKGREADEVWTLDNILEHLKTKGFDEKSEQYKEFANLLTGDVIKNPYEGHITTVGQLYDAISGIPDLQIAVATTRYPRTRPNDLALLGLKGFLDEDYGNSMIINDYDVLTVFEGDYDVDKADYFFQGIDNFWGHIENMKQQWVHGADPDQIEVSNSNLEFLSSNPVANNLSWMRHVGKSNAFGRAIGTVQKLTKTMSHIGAATHKVKDGDLTHNIIGEYNTYDSKGGITGQRRVIMNYNDQNEFQRRSWEAQLMIDAKANTLLFDNIDTWLDNYINPDYDKSISPWNADPVIKDKIAKGENPTKRIRLFEEFQFNKAKDKWEPTLAPLSNTAMHGINNLISHHGRLLQLATDVYDGTGKGRKATYQDMMDVSSNYFDHASDVEMSLFKRNKKYRSDSRVMGIPQARHMFQYQSKEFFSKKANKKIKYVVPGEDFDGFYHPAVRRYYEKLAQGFNGSPFERTMHYLQTQDPLRQDYRPLIAGERFLEVDAMMKEFIDNNYDADNLAENVVGLMKTKNDAIKVIKYLKSQYYKVKSKAQVDGLNRAIGKHEKTLLKFFDRETLGQYLSTGQSKYLPEEKIFHSIDSNEDMKAGTVQMYVLNPVTHLFTGTSKRFRDDLAEMRSFDYAYWSDHENLSSSIRYKESTILKPADKVKFGTRPDPDTLEQIAMDKLTNLVDRHGMMFLWHYAKPKEGTGVGIFNKRPIPYAAKSAGHRYTRMNKYLTKLASEGSTYHQRVLQIVAKRHGVYSNLFSNKTHLVPQGENWLQTEQIRMPQFGKEIMGQLDTFTKINFGRNTNDMSPYSGGLHYDHVTSFFRDLYKMAGREAEYDTFSKDLSKLHEMMQGYNMVDPVSYLLTVERMQTDMYDFVRNHFALKGEDGNIKQMNMESLKDNELYLMMGGQDFQGKGVTLNPVNGLSSFYRIQKQILAGQANEMASRTYSTSEEEWLYGRCGGRAN